MQRYEFMKNPPKFQGFISFALGWIMSEFIINLSNFVCGYPLFCWLIGGGLFLFVYSKAVPLRRFGAAIRALRAKQSGEGQISSFQALMSAISATVGRQQTMPRITEKNGATLLADLTGGTKAVYKYFDLSSTKKITVSYIGDGAVTVNGVPLSGRSAPISGGAHAELCIEVQDGKVDILSFTLE